MAAGGHTAHGRGQLLVRGVLEDVALGAAPRCPQKEIVVVVDGQDQHGRRVRQREEVRQHVQSLPVG